MKKRTKVLVVLSSVLLLSQTYATTIPNTDDPTTFLGPTLRGTFTSSIGNQSAYSLAGEAGLKSGRLGGTLAWEIEDYQRFKVSAEYLWQHIRFGFFPGNAESWGQEASAGVEYQYDTQYYVWLPQVGFNAFVSYSPAKNFGIEQGAYTNSQGIQQNFVVNRRATGSRSYGVGPVITVQPWAYAKLRGEVGYEWVGYDNDFPVNQNARGFGATVSLHSMVSNNVAAGVVAAVRQPFNSYAANLTFTNIPSMRHWTISVYGEYTVGKHTLPDTYNAGLSANFFFDRRAEIIDVAENNVPVTRPIVDDLLPFTSIPAVYMPVVLSVADQEVTLS